MAYSIHDRYMTMYVHLLHSTPDTQVYIQQVSLVTDTQVYIQQVSLVTESQGMSPQYSCTVSGYVVCTHAATWFQ